MSTDHADASKSTQITPEPPAELMDTSCSKVTAEENAANQRRSSSRSIKRKKFDDELVESSILTPKAQRLRALSVTLPANAQPCTSTAHSPAAQTPSCNSKCNSPTPSPTPSVVASTAPLMTTTVQVPSVTTPITPVDTQPPTASINNSVLPSLLPPPPAVETAPPKPKVVSTTAKRRRHRNALNTAVKDLGRWKPQDDLALVIAVQQTNDLEAVYRGVKFSSRFTLQEIEHRWYVLLYDPTIAKIGVAAMRQLHPDVVAQIHAKALYSEQEEALLKKIPSNSQPSIEVFQQLLDANVEVFLQYRTSKELRAHWALMKHYQLLNDQQSATPRPAIGVAPEDVLNFSDAEEQVEKELVNSLSNTSSLFRGDDAISQELMLSNRKTIREIRQLENEIPRWQVLVDSITGVAPSDFDNETLAVLRGRLVRYLMRSREITLGRCTKDSLVDVDLSLEGPSDKISRKQALIKLNSNGDFIITNIGKRPFHVDSKPVLGNVSCAKLFNNSVVEISGLRFVFLVNQDLLAAVRAQELKSHM